MNSRAILALTAIVFFVAAACSDDSDNESTATSTSSSTAASTTTTSGAAPVAVDTCGVTTQDDDFSAGKALLQQQRLPDGDWIQQATPACRWSLDSNELLSVDECVKIADAKVDARTGNAKRTWVDEEQGIRLDAQIELYPSRVTPDVVGRLVTNPQFDTCVENVLAAQAADDPAVEIDDIEVRDFDPDVNPGDLAAGAGPGFEVTFVDGTTITMKVTHDGQTEPVVVRSVMFGIGGVLGSITATTLDGDPNARPTVDKIDWPGTVRAAVDDMVAGFTPSQ